MHTSTAVPSEPSVYIDFALRQYAWDNDLPIPLQDDLVVGMLEQLFRGTTSASRSMLIPRSRSYVAVLDTKHTRSAFHHVASTLKLMLKRYKFPITLHRHHGRIHVRFDPTKVRTNIGDAHALAKEALESLRESDCYAALRYADQALSKDPDATVAAWVITRILQRRPDLPDSCVVSRAQICVARVIGRFAATMRRLRGCTDTSNADAIKARAMAQDMLDRMDKRWHVFNSWPFGESPSDPASGNHRDPVRTFVEQWTDAVRDDVLAYERFAAHPIIIDIAEMLLQRHLRNDNVRRREETVDSLIHAIFERLLLWVPTPVASQEQLKNYLVKFLGRRLNWDELLNQCNHQGVEYDENLDIAEDEDDNPDGPGDDDNDDADDWDHRGKRNEK